MIAGLNYAQYDIDSLITQLNQRLQLINGAWKDATRSGTGEAQIETQAALGNLIMYMIERRAEESFLNTAKLRSSILEMTSLLSFIPRRNVSALGNLTFSVVSPLGYRVFIPSGTIVQTLGGVQFRTLSDVVLLAGQSSISVSAIQGILVELSVVSSGAASFAYNINDTAIEDTHLSVYVDGVEWSVVDSFLLSTSTNTHYRIVPKSDDTVTIIFGDGVRGKVPPVGSTIGIKYIQSLGPDGNVYGSGKVVSLVSKLYNDSGVEVTTISVTNAESMLGGDSAEETEFIRHNAPKVFATGDRAVTKADFIAILKAYSGIDEANAWGESEESAPNYNMFNRIILSIILQDWELPSTTFKTTLSNFLYTLSSMTVKYEFVAPTIVLFWPTIDLTVSAGSNLSQVQSDVITAIGTDFVLGDTALLGVDKSAAEIGDLIYAVPGVVNYHIAMNMYKPLIFNYDSLSDWGETLDVLPVLKESVYVYDGDVLVGVDDGANKFISVHSLYSFSGDSGVNYTTGYVRVNFTSSPVSVAPAVFYRQDNNGDISITNRQILKLEDITVSSITYA